MTDVDEEFEAIRVLVKRSKERGLEVEAVWSLLESIKAGEKDIIKAVKSSLDTWDMLYLD